MNTPTVTSTWLHDHLNDPDLIILDATQPVKEAGLAPELQGIQLPGARFFDIKGTFSDPKSSLPNTFPSPEQFAAEAQKLGINNRSKIVVYDKLGIYSSPRVWWMFTTMGHAQVAVLDGGLPDWIAQRFETEPQAMRAYDMGDFTPRLKEGQVIALPRIHENVHTEEVLVVDARAAGRFAGTAPEPRKGLPSGCIPGSVNLPYPRVLESGKLKSKTELQAVFAEMESGNKPLIFSCGSGITACILLLASTVAMKRNTAVFDGSWTEWALSGLPIHRAKTSE